MQDSAKLQCHDWWLQPYWVLGYLFTQTMKSCASVPCLLYHSGQGSNVSVVHVNSFGNNEFPGLLCLCWILLGTKRKNDGEREREREREREMSWQGKRKKCSTVQTICEQYWLYCSEHGKISKRFFLDIFVTPWNLTVSRQPGHSQKQHTKYGHLIFKQVLKSLQQWKWRMT